MLIERWMWRMVGLCAACESIWWLWTLQNISILYNRGGIWRLFWHCTTSIKHCYEYEELSCWAYCSITYLTTTKVMCHVVWLVAVFIWRLKQNSNNESRHIQGFGAVWWIKPQVIFTMTYTGILNLIGNPSLLLLGKMIINPGNFDLVIKLTL